jgi:uncharacterized protein
MKAVIDTNVFVSYLLSPRGTGAWLLALCSEDRFQLIMTPQLHNELIEVLKRPEIVKRVNEQRKLALLRRFRNDAIWMQGNLNTEGLLPDPGDDILMAASLEAEADFIVTWDIPLLDLGSCQGVRFITPDQFIFIIVRSL